MSYSVSVLKDWLLVWLLLYTTTVNKCRAACRNPSGVYGDIRVIGTVNTTAIFGRMEICDGMKWRAVCHTDWDLQDAMVVCRQLGFDPQGAGYCRGSCFGSRRNIKFLNEFECGMEDERLINCSHKPMDSCPQNRHAGVICAKVPRDPNVNPVICPTLSTPSVFSPSTVAPQPYPTQQVSYSTQQVPYPTQVASPSPSPTSIPPLCDCKAPLPTHSDTSTADTGTEEFKKDNTTTCTAIGGGLGALAAGLALILVGVVMGWVWHCHRSSRKSNFQERDPNSISTNQFPNPTYSSTVPSIQYSSHGPRDTPLNPSPSNPRDTPLNPSPSNPTAETSFATYDIVGSPAPLTEPEEYQVPWKERGVARKGGEKADYQDLDEEGGGEGDYHVLGEIGGGGEGDYHVLGEIAGEGGLTYEVPIPTKMPVQQAANKNTDMDYSLLHHQ